MPRVATPFNETRAKLDECLDRLSKYGKDPEWQELPGYEGRVRKNIDGARVYFGQLLEMVLPQSEKQTQKTKAS